MTGYKFLQIAKALTSRILSLEQRLPNNKSRVAFSPTNTISAQSYVTIVVAVPGLVAGDCMVLSRPAFDEQLLASVSFTSAGNAAVIISNGHAVDSVTLTGVFHIHVIR